MTYAFCHRFRKLSTLIRRCSPEWTHIDVDVLLHTKARYRRARAAELLVLGISEEVLKRDEVCPDFGGIKYFFTDKLGRQLVQNVIPHRSMGDVAAAS